MKHFDRKYLKCEIMKHFDRKYSKCEMLKHSTLGKFLNTKKNTTIFLTPHYRDSGYSLRSIPLGYSLGRRSLGHVIRVILAQ